MNQSNEQKRLSLKLRILMKNILLYNQNAKNRKKSDCIGYLSKPDNQKQFDEQLNMQKEIHLGIHNINKIINIINDHNINKYNDAEEIYIELRQDLIKKISEDKKIIQFLQFLVLLTAIDTIFIQCGSNSLNLLVQRQVDLRNKNFENIKIQILLQAEPILQDSVDINGMNLNGSIPFNYQWQNIKIHELNKLEGHSSTVQSDCFLMINSIRFENVQTGQQKSKLDDHSNYVRLVCLAPDGTTLATSSWDKSIRLWDVKTGQQKSKLDGHRSSVLSVCFSPDGTTLASGSHDNSIRLWEVKTGKEIQFTDKNYQNELAQLKRPLFQSNPLLKSVNTNITILLISQTPIFQAQGALVLQGEFVNYKGVDLRPLLISKGSCLLETSQNYIKSDI